MPVDLANELLRETFRNPNKSNVLRALNRNPADLRRAISNAQRFVMDEDMSEFFAQLATMPFSAARERSIECFTSLRHSAFLQSPKMFVQFDNFAFRKALLKLDSNKVDFWGDTLIAPPIGDSDWPEWAQIPETQGVVAVISFLIEQDDMDPNQIFITEFTSSPDGSNLLALPFQFCFRTDDRPSHPKYGINVQLGRFGHGLNVQDTTDDPTMGIRIMPFYQKLIDANPNKHQVRAEVEQTGQVFMAPRLVPEYGGVIRYVVCLLATLADIPKIIEENPRPAKGFMGKGQVRQYLNYSTMRLNLPRRVTKQTMAARLIAKARRGWHQVQPHWRVMHHYGTFFCASRDDHRWPEGEVQVQCNLCEARRTKIVLPNGRGDPTIAIRTHPKISLHHPKDTDGKPTY